MERSFWHRWLFVFVLLLPQSALGEDQQELLQQLMSVVHNRIAGVPPLPKTLTSMTDHMLAGRKLEAVRLATDDVGFYDLRLRGIFTQWSNVSGDVGADLNDMVATLIGIVRDDLPFNTILSADIIYTANKNLCTSSPYSPSSNNHYRCLQDHNLKTSLQRHQQSSLRGAPSSSAIAGILSTRGFAESYYSAGTNRRATAFVLKHFLCKDLEILHDITVTDGYVRQDVDRTPGGDASLFRRRCVGCHAGLDALSGWNVRYDFRDNRLVYSNVVQNKITRNNLFQYGNVPENDQFLNLWTNQEFGWQEPLTGHGASAWGQMITASRAFATCMAQQVHQQVCFAKGDPETIDQLANKLVASQYNMRELFVATANNCLVDKL